MYLYDHYFAFSWLSHNNHHFYDICFVLLLSGQDIFMAGFVGAMLGGLFATGHILGRNAYFDMLSLQSRLKKEKKKVD